MSPRSPASPASSSAASTRPSTSGWTSSPTSEAADRLRGKVAIANAKLAYARYQALFTGARWQLLAAAGAKTQRLLWASTSIKNPAYKDTMYVEALIGRDTVDTIPPATMDAFRDHGKADARAIEQDVDGARALLADLEQHGISLKEVTDELVEEGVQQFADAFDKLLGAVAQRRRTLLEGDRSTAGSETWLCGDEEGLRGGDGGLAQGRAHPAALGRRQVAVDRHRRGQVARLAARRGAGVGRSGPAARLCRGGEAGRVHRRGLCSEWADRASDRRCWPRPSGARPDGRASTCWTAPIPRRSRRSSARSISARRCSSSRPSPAARWSPTFSWTISSTASARCAARTRPARISSR